MNSSIKWMGGRSGSIERILPIIPEHKTYVEPFLEIVGYFYRKKNLI